MHFQEELKRIEKELFERKLDLEDELKRLPDGEFLCMNDPDGYRRYVQRLPAKGNRKKEHRYGVKKKPEVLNGLVRKEYVNGALKLVDKDIRVLGNAISKYKPIDEKSIMKDFLKKYPELQMGIYAEDLEKWKNEFHRIDDYRPEDLKHTAADGTGSRSKNELYIASRLDHYGIVPWDNLIVTYDTLKGGLRGDMVEAMIKCWLL